MCSTYVFCPGAAKTSFCCSAATAFGTSCRPRPLWTSCGTSWATAAAGPGASRAENSKPRRSCRRCHWVTGENCWKLQFFKEPKRWKKIEKNVRRMWDVVKKLREVMATYGNIWQPCDGRFADMMGKHYLKRCDEMWGNVVKISWKVMGNHGNEPASLKEN